LRLEIDQGAFGAVRRRTHFRAFIHGFGAGDAAPERKTLKGRLVVVNIHQPSSDIYKLFDVLLVMDKGGYPIYYGNPIDA